VLLRRIRLILVVVTLVVLQTAVFPNLRVFGAIPDLCLVATVAVAYEEGAQAGAIFGFASGFFLDLFLSSPAGLSAFAFACTGYGVGLFQSGLMRETRSIGPILGLVGGLVGNTIFVIVGSIVGEPYFNANSLKIIVVAAFYDSLLALVIFPFVRWAVHDAPLDRWR
jgi:rod shape-determining protein MreD